MSKGILALLIFFIFTGHYFLYSNPYSLKDYPLPFPEGEKLHYRIFFKGIPAGEGVLVFHGKKTWNSQEVYYITFKTSIFNFRDIEEIYADKERFLPLRVKRDIRKMSIGRERIEEVYDQEKHSIDISKKGLVLSKKINIKKDSFIHNSILLSYYFRILSLKSIPAGALEVNLPTVKVSIEYKGKKKITTPLGEYECFVFEGRPKNFRFYIADSPRRLPLRIENTEILGYDMVLFDTEVPEVDN